MKSVVVLGKGSLAIQVAGWFNESDAHDLRWVVPVTPEPEWAASFRSWAETAGVPLVESGRHEDLPQGDIDLAVSVTYSHIVGEDFIGRCGRILNIHNSPLPRYRGASPVNWALRNGERTHGVTIHEINARVDQGPIVGQVLFSVYPEVDEVRDVYERCLAFGWTLFQEVMPRLDEIEAVPQDESLALYHARAENELLGDRRSWTRLESQ